MDNQSWPDRYRPHKFEQLVGQTTAIRQLTGMVTSKKIPKALLFSGASGLGKTSAARILAYAINNVKYGQPLPDLYEPNSASTRGIDDIRAILATINYAPRKNFRVYIIDECFAKNTLVATVTGDRPIQDIVPGDRVWSQYRLATVTDVFTNQVPLDNIMLLDLDNGKTICCTQRHIFYTKHRGEVTARHLNSQDQLIGNKGSSSWPTPIKVTGQVFFSPATADLFNDYISMEELAHGFATFHDLQIFGHPSYVVHDVVVHNCHKITGVAADALLKPIEDSPPQTVWMLCTNEPQLLKKPLRDRCYHIAMRQPQPAELLPLLTRICRHERLHFRRHNLVLKKLAAASKGTPRAAVQLLQGAADVASSGGSVKEILAAAINSSDLVASDRVAVKILAAIYLKKPKSALAALNDTNEYISLVNALLNFNRWLLSNHVPMPGWRSPLTAQLQQLLGRQPPSLTNIIAVHSALVDTRTRMQQFAVPEQQLLLAVIGKLSLPARN